MKFDQIIKKESAFQAKWKGQKCQSLTETISQTQEMQEQDTKNTIKINPDWLEVINRKIEREGLP